MRGIIRILLVLFAITIPSVLYVGSKPQSPSVRFSSYTFPCFQRGTYYWISLKRAPCTIHSNYNAFPDTTSGINSMGFRGKEIGAKRPGVRRLLLLGDSFIFGMGLPDDVILAAALPSFDSINAGLPTADASYYYLFLKNEIDLLSPDVVVVGFYPYNDIYDPETQIVWDKTDAVGLPLSAISATKTLDARGNIVAKTPGLKPHEWQSGCLFETQCHDRDADISRTKKLFTAMRTITQEHNIPFLVLMIPATFQFLKTPEARIAFGVATPLTREELRRPQTIFRQYFADEHIPFIDLLPVFSQYPNPAELFINGDPHWSEKGMNLVAQTIYAAIR